MSLRTVIREHLPEAVARSYYRRQAERYIHGLDCGLDPYKPTLLAVNHFYDQDLKALRLTNTEYNFVQIDSPVLFKGAKIHFSDNVQAMNAPYEAEPAQNRAHWRRECRYMLELLLQKFGVNLIVVPADCYYWIREFIAVARENGIKTVVINKEGIISPWYFEEESRRIRMNAPYMCDHLYVWSERQRRYWNRAGVADQDMTVIGQPRSDLFYLENDEHVRDLFPDPRPIITFFSYQDTAYVPVELQRRDGISWRQMKQESHATLRGLAREFKEYNFVIKTHPQQPDCQALQSTYETDNMRVVGGSSLGNELLRRSEFIIGFQTTALIEAMFLNKPIVYTCWDPNFLRLKADLLPFHNAPGVNQATTRREFQDITRTLLKQPAGYLEEVRREKRARRKFVDQYLYRPDGNVCRRFYDSVRRFVS